MVELVRPSVAYRDSYLEAMAEYEAAGDPTPLRLEVSRANFTEVVDRLERWRQARDLPRGWVPVSVFWLVDEVGFIGHGAIRHEISNDRLLNIAGHIGYSVRPSRRREGHGTDILRRLLPECRKLGLDRALVTCDADNTGSKKIIERNGGAFEDERPGDRSDGTPKRRYWIELP